MEDDKQRLIRTAGLTGCALRDLDRRRTQLWLLSLLGACTLPVVVVVLGTGVLPAELVEFTDLTGVRIGLLTMLVAIFAYVAEREQTLRRLTRLLTEERTLVTSLRSQVSELDALMRACRAMNSRLDLGSVLDVILDAASDLLHATGGSIRLVAGDDAGVLEVVVTRGRAHSPVGERQSIHQVLGRAAALVVPLEVRGELVGVLDLEAEGTGFTEIEQRSVSVYADAAAAAITNARLHEASEQRVARLMDLDRSKDEFLTTVTHELRTPLTSMIGLASTLAKGADRLSADQVRELAETAQSQGWRLDRMVDDLLSTSRADRRTLRVAPQLIDAVEVVTSVILALRAAAQDHELALQAPPGPVWLRADPDALARILTNLVGNAAKYTSAGSHIDVRMAVDAGGLVLTVSDDGPGLSTDERERAFEKFHRCTADRGGLGLGLYLVRALAEAHGGTARLQAAPAGGLQAVIRLAEIGVDAPPAPLVPQLSSTG